METQAKLYGVRLSAQKGRLVADLIRGRTVEQALNILAFTPKKSAQLIKKVLESAIANAEHNDGADVDELRVSRIDVDQGFALKRFQARAKGRGNRIIKRTCHIFVTVSDQPAKPRKATTKRRKSAATESRKPAATEPRKAPAKRAKSATAK